jgi:hypothetical protein
MPGVAILLEACLARATARVEAQRCARGQGVGGNEVPDVERENVSGEEVDVVGGEVDPCACQRNKWPGLRIRR